MSYPGQFILDWGNDKRRIKVFAPINADSFCQVIVIGVDGFWTQRMVKDEAMYDSILNKSIDLFTFK